MYLSIYVPISCWLEYICNSVKCRADILIPLTIEVADKKDKKVP